MKIIDLLNKIANGEYPDFKYYGGIYKYNKKLEKYLYGDMWFDFNSFENLNDEVEIIEEEKKIPEKIDNSYYHLGQNQQNQLFKNTINEIIDYLKSKGE